MSDKTTPSQQAISVASKVNNPKIDPLLSTREAAEHLNVSKSYLDKLRVYGGGPEFIRLSKRKILYRQSALDCWAHQRRFGSTSEY